MKEKKILDIKGFIVEENNKNIYKTSDCNINFIDFEDFEFENNNVAMFFKLKHSADNDFIFNELISKHIGFVIITQDYKTQEFKGFKFN